MKRNVREKPHRLPRDCYRGRVIVAFTACVDNRHTPYLDSVIVNNFLDSLNKAATKSKCLVPIYCFMPDHVHVILQGHDDLAGTALKTLGSCQSYLQVVQHQKVSLRRRSLTDPEVRGTNPAPTRRMGVCDM